MFHDKSTIRTPQLHIISPHNHAVLQGFTLVELLVVISIIALLISMLLPALSSARESARFIRCASNQRQIFIAHTAYVNDSKDYVIQAYDGTATWQNYITNYMEIPYTTTDPPTQDSAKAASSVYVCPSLPSNITLFARTIYGSPNHYLWTSYGWNAYYGWGGSGPGVYQPATNNYGWPSDRPIRTTGVPYPSTTALTGDLQPATGRTYVMYSLPSYSTDGPSWESMLKYTYHLQSTNMAMSDGHVTALRADADAGVPFPNDIWDIYVRGGPPH